MPVLGCEERDEMVGKRFAGHGGIGAVEGQAILEFTDDEHSGHRRSEPVLDLLDHVLPVAIHQPHQGRFVEAEERCRLQEAVGTAERAPGCMDQLPELETDDA